MDTKTLKTMDELINGLRNSIVSACEKTKLNGGILSLNEIDEQLEIFRCSVKKQEQAMLDKVGETEHLERELARALKHIKMKNREIHEISVTDSMTGLLKQELFVTIIDEEIARCRRYGYPLAAMKVTVDGLIGLIDRYGLVLGDKVLAYTGSAIKENIRKFDRAFRLNNEEFIIILPETDLTLAYMAAERLRKNYINNTFMVNKNGDKSEENVSCSISIGITATYPYASNSMQIDDLLDQMNKALFKARESGGNMSMQYE